MPRFGRLVAKAGEQEPPAGPGRGLLAVYRGRVDLARWGKMPRRVLATTFPVTIWLERCMTPPSSCYGVVEGTGTLCGRD